MPDVRRILIETLEPLTRNVESVAVLLSAGLDSNSCALALRALGKRVVAYSFTLDGWRSTDFRFARSNAKTFGFDFRPILLPRSIRDLKRDCRYLALIGAQSKTDFECGWPMVRALREIDEPIVVTGHGADSHFCLSKKGMMHYRNDRIDEYRQERYSNPNVAHGALLAAEAKRHNKLLARPYFSDAMIETFRGTSWDEINKPRQKQPIIDAFPDEIRRLKFREHTNLQLGDSGIAEHFRILLDSDWNVSGAKTPTGIYNALVAGRLA